MIKQIYVKGFQSHKETTLELHEGVNAIVGLSGSGKSVIFKAMSWLFSNRPLGDEYHSWFGGDTQVELVLDDEQKVGRIRKYEDRKGEWIKADDFYYVDKKEFRAFGNGTPPQPVLDTLNISTVNLQMQGDPAFLISNSSGEVARYLNKAANLDVIDQTLANIASRLRGEKLDLERAKADLGQAQNQLQQYNWLPDADEILTSWEGFQKHVDELKVESSSLSKIVREYEKVGVELSEVESILVFSPQANQLLDLHTQIEKQNQGWEKLAVIVDQHEKAEKELSELMPLEGMRTEVERLAGLRLSIEVQRKLRGDLSLVAQQIDSMTVALEQAEKSKKALEVEFNKLMPNVCPLCDGTGGRNYGRMGG